VTSIFEAIDRFAAFDWIVLALVLGAFAIIAIEALWVLLEHRAYNRRRKQRGGDLHHPGHTRLGIDKAKHIDE